MCRQMSRAQREAIFLEKAVQMYATLEDWYDQHPEASFGEIEAEARGILRETESACGTTTFAPKAILLEAAL